MTVYTRDQVTVFAQRAGFTGNGLDIIVAISKAESAWNSHPKDNVNTDSMHSRDRGILQINSFWHPEVSDSCCYDPQCSFNECYRISSKGTNFNQWSTFTNGNYKQFLLVNDIVNTLPSTPTIISGNVLPFTTIDNAIQNSITALPGFEGLVEAIDLAEQFQPLNLPTASTGQNTDYTIFGIDTKISNPLTSITLPIDSMQAFLVFVVTNTRAFVIRAMLVILGIIILVAIFQNFYQANVSSKIDIGSILGMVA